MEQLPLIDVHFSLIDAIIVGVYLVATMAAGVMVRRYVGKVEHFLVAGREMNTYLGIASLAATEFGIVTCMYTAQEGHDFGFGGTVPGIAMAIGMLVVGLTGFCIKPLRDAGVITIPELFEKRFGYTVRWMSGVVIVLGGLLNMGVFLRVGGDFLVNVTGLKPSYNIFGYNVPTLETTMTILLLAVAIYTIMGGMLSVLVTDYLQFVVMSLGLLVVTALILYRIGWTPLVDAVQKNYGAGGFNPFVNPKLGWAWVTLNVLLNFAAVLTWQTTIARVLAAKDTKTGRKIYTATSFFFVARFLIPGIWGIAALAILPAVPEGGDTLQEMPRFLGTFVPLGMMGVLIAAMLAADMSTDSSYMLTWGSVIYNDIMAPIHKGQWSERRGLLVNRVIVAVIGAFLLFFGLWYKVEGALWDYITITGTIYLSSMSVLLIACCYWRGANSWGAGAAIIVGAAVPTAFLIMEKLPSTAAAMKEIGKPVSGLVAFAGAVAAMILGSLLTGGPKGERAR